MFSFLLEKWASILWSAISLCLQFKVTFDVEGFSLDFLLLSQSNDSVTFVKNLLQHLTCKSPCLTWNLWHLDFGKIVMALDVCALSIRLIRTPMCLIFGW